MNDGTKQEEIKRLEALATNQEHIRRSALKQAGILLRYSEQQIIDELLNDLDVQIIENNDLYNAYCELAERIAKEVVQIGDELIAQYKALKKGNT